MWFATLPPETYMRCKNQIQYQSMLVLSLSRRNLKFKCRWLALYYFSSITFPRPWIWFWPFKKANTVTQQQIL